MNNNITIYTKHTHTHTESLHSENVVTIVFEYTHTHTQLSILINHELNSESKRILYFDETKTKQ